MKNRQVVGLEPSPEPLHSPVDNSFDVMEAAAQQEGARTAERQHQNRAAMGLEDAPLNSPGVDFDPVVMEQAERQRQATAQQDYTHLLTPLYADYDAQWQGQIANDIVSNVWADSTARNGYGSGWNDGYSMSSEYVMPTELSYSNGVVEEQSWFSSAWDVTKTVGGALLSGMVDVVYQPVAQVLDLAELAFVALPYNLMNDDTYRLTGFSNVSKQRDFGGGFRAAFEYNPVVGVGIGSYDATTSFQQGDYVGGSINAAGTLLGFVGVKGGKQFGDALFDRSMLRSLDEIDLKLLDAAFPSVSDSRYVSYGSFDRVWIGSPRETGDAVQDLLYGAKAKEGLPGGMGVEIAGRPTSIELENLTVKHDVEFAVTYKLGPGKNGSGGQYFLHSGDNGSVDIPLEADRMFISHTHPQGTPLASPADRRIMEILELLGSPQRTSTIVPVGRETVQFNKKTTINWWNK